jgi:hypothetical protein
MEYSELSEEAKETLKGMVEFCINNAIGMGMDEGFNADDTKKEFRKELELFMEAKN